MDWSRYNEELVRRGEAVFDLDFLRDHRNELKKMNMGKVGRRFRYPESLIIFLATVKYLFHLPYRQLEGVIQGLSECAKPILTPDYTDDHTSLYLPEVFSNPFRILWHISYLQSKALEFLL